MLNKIALSAGCIFLASCSSLNSIDTPSEADGLTYYLPKKDFQVTITVANNEITQVALGTTPAYPDLTKRFVLNFGSNYFGENTLDVSIDSNGLLTLVNQPQ